MFILWLKNKQIQLKKVKYKILDKRFLSNKKENTN